MANHTEVNAKELQFIPVIVERCTSCDAPAHASETNDDGVCTTCAPLPLRCDECGNSDESVRHVDDGAALNADVCETCVPASVDYAASVATRDEARAVLMRICTPLAGTYCCVQLVPNDGRPGGARCHEHNAWAATWLGFATKLDRDHAVRLLRGQGFNYFVFFRESNFEYALQYGFATWVKPGGISVQL